MTRYEQGFMSKCAEYGVDGRVLLSHLRMRKTAQASDDARIGMSDENSLGTTEVDKNDVIYSWYPRSYYGRLLGNVSGAKPKPVDGRMITAPFDSYIGKNLYFNAPHYDTEYHEILEKELENRRRSQARENARDLTYSGAVRKRIEQNLIEAGKKNHQNYIETGTVPKRETIDRTGIEKMVFTPEEEAALLEMQNTMAQNTGRRSVATA